MDNYNKTYEVIWADIDPNRHMRHSVYNDYAAQTRVSMFADFGISLQKFADMDLGPILFREETKFLREIHLSETILVTCRLASMKKNASRWSFQHEIFREDEIKAAEIIVEGAWLNLKSRKIGAPSDILVKSMYDFPRTEAFKWIAE